MKTEIQKINYLQGWAKDRGFLISYSSVLAEHFIQA